MRSLRLVLTASLVPVISAAAARAHARQPAQLPKCTSDSAFHALDFWVGDWTVVDSAGTPLGKNRIEKILDGCAITETWHEPESEGRSLFYYVPAQRAWKQVWVTPSALVAGGMKEKHLIASGPGRARFQGELFGPAGLLILDRTTLTAIANARVRQVIEISRDGGTTWRTTFDGIYVPVGAPRRPSVDPRDTMSSFAVGGSGLSLADRDTSVRPGDDFSRYQNGRWLDSVVRAGLTHNDSYWRDLMRLPTRRVVSILQELGSKHGLSPEAPEGKAAAFYRSFTDSAAIRQKGIAPLGPALQSIRRATTHAEIARVMGEEAGAWTPRPPSVTVQTFPLALFAIRVDQNPRDVTRNAVILNAAGQLLPAPSYYSDPAQEEVRRAYVDYIAKMLRLVNWPEPDQRARDILELEKRISAVRPTSEEMRTVAGRMRSANVAQLAAMAPEFDWSGFLSAAGLSPKKQVVVAASSMIPSLTKIFAETPVSVWAARQAFAVLDQDAPKLSDAAAELALDFRSRQFQGTAASQPREFRVMVAADATIPDIIGTLYAKRYFPPALRAATEDMARRIRDAFDARLASSPYLSDASKHRAREKLAAMKLDIGAPTAARDYPGLVLSDTDYFGNLRRAREYEWRREVASLDKPFDRNEWPLQPHNSNYSYVPNANVMEVSAGALEPPFFDLAADPAVNYGAIGTLIGAQMAAAFDVTGRQYGPDGGLAAIFTPQETARLNALRDSLARRLSTIEALPGVRLPGNLIVDEDINDIVGMQIALDAYHNSLNGRPAEVIGTTTGDQRFFLGHAQMWRSAFVPAFIQWLAATGHNTPPPIRMNVTVQHLDAWYDAFGVQAGQKLYLRPDERLRFFF